MNLLSFAVPFFLAAILIELAVDRHRKTGYYRLSDAIASMSTGALSTTVGLFTKLMEVAIYGFVLQHFAWRELDPALFAFSPSGLGHWLLALLLWDFCYYWAHRAGHEVSVFWAAHVVHHQSEDYNLSTALRQTSTGFLLGWIFYIPMFLIGVPVEVFASVAAIDLIYQFWVHTQHVRRLGWLDRVFVTPSNHRVHHAQNGPYIDRNYGGILIIWDRLFGTFQDELQREPAIFGVRKPLASWSPFAANIDVYGQLWSDARRARRWRDKLGIWFRRTGWRPGDVARKYPLATTDLGHFEKFDAKPNAGLRSYVVAQFIVAALATSAISMIFARLAAGSVLAMCLALWMLLYNLGQIDEGRAGALRLERIRLLLVTPMLAAWLLWVHAGQLARAGVVTGLALYCLGSVLWLEWARRRQPARLAAGAWREGGEAAH